MLSLTEKQSDSFELDGHVLSVDMSFDNILLMFDLFKDETFSNYEKVDIALEMLIYDYEYIKSLDLDFNDTFSLYEYLLKEFLGIDLGDKDKASSTSDKKVMDFTKDAGLIYASFLSEYQIDLHKELGKLHWNTFSTLLTHLGDKTAFKQVVSYRTMKVPSQKEASEDYRKHVMKMKQLYSLEDEQEKLESLENTLDAVASTFGGGR